MRVALTFDAELPGRSHYDPDGAGKVLDLLGDRRTTWFLQGRWCLLEPIVADQVAVHHLIGSHSYFHANLPMYSPEGLRQDTRMAEAAIFGATGVNPRPFYRAPNLASNMEVEEILGEEGYFQPVGADINPGDWEPGIPSPILLRRILDELDFGAGPVICLHTWPNTTVRMLPHLLAALDRRGVDYIGVDEL
jgi:peptidoglycan/xylan/chitin deacetylase (PgdA/CDA1 family)